MASAVGYFGDRYWATNYWAGSYWSPTPTPTGGHWATNYWSDDYWAGNYWADSTLGSGDIFVTDDAPLTLTEFAATVLTGNIIQATTPTRTLTALQTDSNIDIEITATLTAMPLTGFDLGIETSGYVLGDIDLTFSPESTITVTYGNWPGTPALPTVAHHPTTQTNDGLDVGISHVELAVDGFVTDASNPVGVFPDTVVLDVTGYDSPAAGIGELIPVTRPAMTLTGPTHTISGVPVANIKPNIVNLVLDARFATIIAKPPLTIPDPTWPGDSSILNENAAEYPSNYEICDRTGFKLRRGSLVTEWTGAMVRKESWERRHIQDFVRGVPDDLEGSPRPEQTDRFIDEEYPQGVTADDL
jgi:hypothetical protein